MRIERVCKDCGFKKITHVPFARKADEYIVHICEECGEMQSRFGRWLA